MASRRYPGRPAPGPAHYSRAGLPVVARRARSSAPRARQGPHAGRAPMAGPRRTDRADAAVRPSGRLGLAEHILLRLHRPPPPARQHPGGPAATRRLVELRRAPPAAPVSVPTRGSVARRRARASSSRAGHGLVTDWSRPQGRERRARSAGGPVCGVAGGDRDAGHVAVLPPQPLPPPRDPPRQPLAAGPGATGSARGGEGG